jgi:1,4-dihydroxy-2-naphthoate octaprenyltransferase
MERYKVFVLFVLALMSTSFAAENETIIQPSAPQTTSIEKILSSMDAMKKSIEELKVNNNELRVQLDSKLSSQYWGILLFVSVYTVFLLSVRGILGEVWTWLMYSRKKRKIEKFQEKIASELRNTDTELRNVTAMLQIIHSSLASIKSDVVAVEKQKKPEIKRSFWDKLLGRKKDAQ